MVTRNSVSWEDTGLEGAVVLFDIMVPEYTPTNGLKVYERRITAFRNPDLIMVQSMDPKKRGLEPMTPAWYVSLFETTAAGAGWPKENPYLTEEKKLVDKVTEAYALRRD